jgi:hypothetical protein
VCLFKTRWPETVFRPEGFARFPAAAASSEKLLVCRLFATRQGHLPARSGALATTGRDPGHPDPTRVPTLYLQAVLNLKRGDILYINMQCPSYIVIGRSAYGFGAQSSCNPAGCRWLLPRSECLISLAHPKTTWKHRKLPLSTAP